MLNKLILITGASRGLGKALAKQLAHENSIVVGISRHNNSELAAFCKQVNAPYRHIQADLGHAQGAAQAAEVLTTLLGSKTELNHYWLINNAGTVEPMAQSHQLLDAWAISQAMQLNVSSVMALTGAFLAHSPTTADRRVLNISSGAGRGPVPGWAVYGSSKAAIDAYTQTVAAEHPSLRVVSLAPGVIDTDMQQAIRHTDEAQFPNKARFVALRKEQQLTPASTTAEHIARYLAHDDFGNQIIDDIRHYF